MQSIDLSNNLSGIIESFCTFGPFLPFVEYPKVWLREDRNYRIRKILEAPYSGPFDDILRNYKFFKPKFPQGDTTVSIDRLKPAYLKDINIPNDSISNDIVHPVSHNTLTSNDVGSNVGEDICL